MSPSNIKKMNTSMWGLRSRSASGKARAKTDINWNKDKLANNSLHSRPCWTLSLTWNRKRILLISDLPQRTFYRPNRPEKWKRRWKQMRPVFKNCKRWMNLGIFCCVMTVSSLTTCTRPSSFSSSTRTWCGRGWSRWWRKVLGRVKPKTTSF